MELEQKAEPASIQFFAPFCCPDQFVIKKFSPNTCIYQKGLQSL